jgi:ABC-type transport system involved in cytochrome c biogenesis ATPase subunit
VYSPADREALVDRGQEQERDREQVSAGRERRLALAEDIRRLEVVRERLLAVDEIAGTLPADHKMRARLDDLSLERVVEELDADLRDLYDRTAHPRGT